jgi:molybdate transport system substrate-binding protein
VLRRIAPTAAVLAVVLAFPLGSVPAGASRGGGKPSGDITVSAAASLTDAFTAIGQRFEKEHPRASVTFNFGSSATLVTQIQGGAPADVYASADLTNMDKLVSGGQVTKTPTPFARNQLQIAVKPGNPRAVTGLSDLSSIGTVSLCGASVPCGVYAATALKKAAVTIPESSITRGVDAKSTIAAVAQGDAEAAIVYVTDVKAAGSAVAPVVIPDAQNVVAVYPIAPIASTGNPKLAKAFVEYVGSPDGQRILARYGFLPA